MSSFVNLLADDVWTESDIVNRTEALVRREISAEAETILNRKLSGALLGMHTLTADDELEAQRFAEVTRAAQAAGAAARADMALLQQAWAVEAAQRRLLLPVVQPVAGEGGAVLNQVALEADATERTAALATIEGASDSALDLVVRRRPVESGAELGQVGV